MGDAGLETMAAAGAPAPAGQVLDFMKLRLERALRQRLRYRYVRPSVLREGEGWRIEAPCCSRNVDPDGGVIDIALLAPCATHDSLSQSGRVPQSWQLFARDHASGSLVPQHESERIDELMDLLCIDAQRIYWP